MHTVCYFSYKR